MKNETQRGETSIIECQCGGHIIRLVKDYETNPDLRRHSIEFWEPKGSSSDTYWDKIKLAFSILFKKHHSVCTFEVLLTNDQVDNLIKDLEYMKTP